MLNYPDSQVALDATFQALADTTRRTMLVQLARGPLSVTELARPLAMSLPAVAAALVLAALAFGFKPAPYDMILMGFVTIFTLSSVSLYLVEWLRHMSTIEAK